MNLILFVILVSLISTLTSLIITVIINDMKLKKIVKTYGKDLERISSHYISKVDLLKDRYEELLLHKEELMLKEEKQGKHINYNNTYLKESFISFIEALEQTTSLEEFYYLRDNLRNI